ncbi:prenyltransferase [Nitrincola tibetensis]|uniref:Prenyltransferase n=1 Tax=Nitrincola tibetensis TaxID=2219697 RepID=A0A364NRP3_9GAMM|nr:prenyltransferase [Nitrincola tibetensis]RAU19714.1 prenyltransferase [Nitrincola tibetensis]
MAKSYDFIRAVRPFSFPVALITCGLGVLMAFLDGVWSPSRAGLILVAGVLLQAGVNLINDYADLTTHPQLSDKKASSLLATRQIVRNFQLGLLAILLAAAIGFYLVIESDPLLLWICVIGFIGCLGYTLPPLSFKHRGLGVILVFWLMGVLMVKGSYLALGASFNPQVVLMSLPISCLVSLLLLSNELRDYEVDSAQRITTLAVKIGYEKAQWLYIGLLIASVLVSLALWLSGLLPTPYWLVLSLPFLVKPLRLLGAEPAVRIGLTPATARFLLLYGLCFAMTLVQPILIAVFY